VLCGIFMKIGLAKFRHTCISRASVTRAWNGSADRSKQSSDIARSEPTFSSVYDRAGSH